MKNLEGQKRKDGTYVVTDPHNEGERSWRWVGIFFLVMIVMVLISLLRIALGAPATLADLSF